MYKRITLLALCIVLFIPISFASSSLPYSEVMVGFDGPIVEKPSLVTIDTKEALQEHWISKKLGAEMTEALTKEIDFNSQFIVVVQVGVRNTATGNLNIAEIEYHEDKTNVVVYVRVGVNERDYKLPKHRSLPYAIGVIDKPEIWPTKVNYYIGNFGDGCKVPRGI